MTMPARTIITPSSIMPTTWRSARIPTGEVVTSTETVALKGGGGGEGAVQGCEGGGGGEGGGEGLGGGSRGVHVREETPVVVSEHFGGAR